MSETNDAEQRDPEEKITQSEEKEKASEEAAIRITNDAVETDPVRNVVNKKLSTLSKETKERKKNRKRPLKPPKDKFALRDINPMYLLTFIGVIIAGVSLYYTWKAAMKEEEEDTAQREEAHETQRSEKNSAPDETPRRERGSVSATHGVKGPDHMDPFYAQRHKIHI